MSLGIGTENHHHHDFHHSTLSVKNGGYFRDDRQATDMVQTRQRQIRPARARDRDEVDRLYDICLRTGANGEGAQDLYEDPRLLGEVYLGAYLEFEPHLAFVVEADDGSALGYVLGAGDTVAFERLLAEQWWPALRRRYPLGHFPQDSHDERMVQKIHAPRETDPATIDGYPAHLHVDILAEGRGGGNGRRLMETLFSALRQQGVEGVHLNVSPSNTHAIGFYGHLGFTWLSSGAMGKSL